MLRRFLPTVFFCILCFFKFSDTTGQNNSFSITVKVFSFFDNQTLEGVHFVVNDILRATSDAKGYATIKVNPNETIILSMIGYERKEIAVIDLAWSEINHIYLMPEIITLPGLIVQSTWLESDVILPVKKPLIVEGINEKPIDQSPVKPGTFAAGYDPATLAPSLIFMGPFSYFSNKERQKRKLARAIKNEEPDKLKNIMLADAEIKDSFLSIYHIDSHVYNEFLGYFNSIHAETSFLSAYDLLETMHLEIKNYLMEHGND